MAGFTIRVELHYGTEQDYEKLHGAMAVYGFLRTIVSDDGAKYKLPPGEYRSPSSSSNYTTVCKNASAAAATTGCKFAVFVTMGDTCTWDGLDKV